MNLILTSQEESNGYHPFNLQLKKQTFIINKTLKKSIPLIAQHQDCPGIALTTDGISTNSHNLSKIQKLDSTE